MENSLSLAWSNLYTRLYNFVSKKIKNEDAAKDILQDVFIKVQSNIHLLNNEKKVHSWIFRITQNTINDYYRNLDKSLVDAPIPEIGSTSLSGDETAKLSECILPMIDLLPDKYSEALKLADIEGVSQKELARQLGISYSGAKSRVQRARKILKEEIKRCCEVKSDNYGNIIEFEQKSCCDGCD